MRRGQTQRVFANENLDPRLRVGLVGHWIGGGSGLTWFDRSGYGNHGTLTNGPEWTLQSNNMTDAPKFDGTDDYVTMGDVARLEVEGSLPFSLAAWYMPTTSPALDEYNGICNKGTGGSAGWGFHYNRTGSGYAFDLTKYGVAGQAQLISGALTVGRWYHVAAVQNATTVDYYLDGVLLGSVLQASAYIASGANPFIIGMTSSTSFGPAHAIINDVRVYARALAAAEVALLASPSFQAVVPQRRRSYDVAAGGLPVQQIDMTGGFGRGVGMAGGFSMRGEQRWVG